MWISRQFYNAPLQASEIGTVTVSSEGKTDTAATVRTKGIPVYSPYGYSFCTPKGEDMLLVSSALGAVGSGTKMENKGLAPGEIAITSIGGAKIFLKNDGTVVINGIVVTKSGEIINSEGEIITR